ncbi:MAG: hypothetical protein ACXADY_20740 [Candidatus Hodarchaeales archaeon]|jgi:bifunctional DNA-binding transcriptional regulator/antitoxin component of YhaV-PrlF toxin-antitoxin module
MTIGIFVRKICKKNQIHIPQEIMESCGLKVGMIVQIFIKPKPLTQNQNQNQDQNQNQNQTQVLILKKS